MSACRHGIDFENIWALKWDWLLVNHKPVCKRSRNWTQGRLVLIKKTFRNWKITFLYRSFFRPLTQKDIYNPNKIQNVTMLLPYLLKNLIPSIDFGDLVMSKLNIVKIFFYLVLTCYRIYNLVSKEFPYLSSVVSNYSISVVIFVSFLCSVYLHAKKVGWILNKSKNKCSKCLNAHPTIFLDNCLFPNLYDHPESLRKTFISEIFYE